MEPTLPNALPETLETEHPARRLIQRGGFAVTDGELLSLLIAEGKSEDITHARALMLKAGTLHQLARLSYHELAQHKGVTPIGAVRVLAAWELARRRDLAQHREINLSEPASVAAYVRPRLIDLPHEAFFVLYLNRQGVLVHEQVHSTGGVSATTIDPKTVFKEALLHLASGLIVCHNHPSGSLEPSTEDHAITRKLSEGARLLDMQLLDHLIVSYKGYYSFANEKQL